MDYNDGKWHGWNGGERPVPPKTKVHYYALGNTQVRISLAEELEWDAEICQIIVFRAVRAPREFWLDPRYSDIRTAAFPGAVHVREVMENEDGR